ncbi:MAG: VOC family protein [Actinomycetota bacterium]|nr:VOC family protein [Actinomycetota bacterium]
MDKITPHLWFDKEAVEAAEFYCSTFSDSKVTGVSTLSNTPTPSGDTDIVTFELFGQTFQAISAGPLLRFTPAVSFFVQCETKDEVDAFWNKLHDGNALMPLDSYPFSEHYGWTEDRYGLSWQVGYIGDQEMTQRITPTLMFVGDIAGKAEEAVNFYTSVFPNSKVGDIFRYAAGEEPDREGTVRYVGFSLDGQEFAAMDSAQDHRFGFNEAISFLVGCEDQSEIDRFWDKLSAVPESEQCGWLKDRFGLSWQIIPRLLDEYMARGTQEQIDRVTQAFLQMKKFDLAELQRAYEGTEARVGGEG